MDTLKKIEKMCFERGWTVYKLALESGLSQSTLANMYLRGTQPSLATLTAICEAFGITLSQFFDDGTTENAVLSPQEKLLIQEYRRVSEENRELVLALTKKLN